MDARSEASELWMTKTEPRSRRNRATRRQDRVEGATCVLFSAGVEVLSLRVMHDQRVRGLLGMQLEFLGQLDPDPFGLQQ